MWCGSPLAPGWACQAEVCYCLVTAAFRGREERRLLAIGRRSAHLAALSALAFAQPLFDILGKNPAFFAVRGSSRGEIVLFALALTLLPPVVLVVLELAAELVSAVAARSLHLLFVAGLEARLPRAGTGEVRLGEVADVGRRDRLRRAVLGLADGPARPRRRCALSEPRRARTRRDVVSERHDRAPAHGARRPVAARRQVAGPGSAAGVHGPPEQCLHAARSLVPAPRNRGAHPPLPAEPLQEAAEDPGLRRRRQRQDGFARLRHRHRLPAPAPAEPVRGAPAADQQHVVKLRRHGVRRRGTASRGRAEEDLSRLRAQHLPLRVAHLRGPRTGLLLPAHRPAARSLPLPAIRKALRG